MNKMQWKLEFYDRFCRHEAELTQLYRELYHNDMAAFDRFTDMLYDAYTARPEGLKLMDQAREAHSDWYKGHDLVGMLMYVNAFAGTLHGVREKLGYIEDCGVNYLHLMPLLESPKGRSDGGYAVSDFRKVQPELGTMEDLYTLAMDCHERGIAVCLDFVMNHTSEDHEWAKRARAGERDYQDRYFFYEGWDIPNAYEQTVPQVFPTTAPGNFTWCEEAHKVVMTTFYPYQWDLNYANPAVFQDMTDNMLNLCNHGVDVIRLDAVPYIWKALGTNCRNLPQVHTLVRMMRMVCEIVCPGTLLLGEVVMEPSKVVPYFGTVDRPECHMLYNVTTMATLWHTVATGDVRLLQHQMGQVFALPKEYTFLNYLRCHDDIGWGLDYPYLRQFGQEEVPHKRFLNDYLTGYFPGSTARGELYNDDPRLMDARLCGTTASLCGIEAARQREDDAALEKAVRLDEMLHAFMFTLSGVPVLYSGDEVGRENDYGYHRDPFKKEDSRYLHRGDMDWALADQRKDETTVAGRLFTALQRMEGLRAQHPVFDDEADTWLLDTGNDAVIGIGRYYRGQKLLAVFNFSRQEQTAWLKETEDYTDLMAGCPRSAGAVVLPAGGFAWLLHEYKAEERSFQRGVTEND
jgi:amylosucrase